jgi:hypothetical protein
VNDNIDIPLSSRENLDISILVIIFIYWTEAAALKEWRYTLVSNFLTIAKSSFLNRNTRDIDIYELILTEIIVILSLFSSDGYFIQRKFRRVLRTGISS